MGKKGDTENLKSSLRIAPKNVKKIRGDLLCKDVPPCNAYFHIFLSSRGLKRKNFLINDFSPCYLNGKYRPFGGGGSNRSNWTLSPYGIFFIIFLEIFYIVTLMKK